MYLLGFECRWKVCVTFYAKKHTYYLHVDLHYSIMVMIGLRRSLCLYLFCHDMIIMVNSYCDRRSINVFDRTGWVGNRITTQHSAKLFIISNWEPRASSWNYQVKTAWFDEPNDRVQCIKLPFLYERTGCRWPACQLWPILPTWFNLIPSCTSSHMPSKVWYDIPYPFPNFNGCAGLV